MTHSLRVLYFDYFNRRPDITPAVGLLIPRYSEQVIERTKWVMPPQFSTGKTFSSAPYLKRKKGRK